MPKTKNCPRCGERKPQDAFGRDRSRSDELAVYCLQCRRIPPEPSDELPWTDSGETLEGGFSYFGSLPTSDSETGGVTEPGEMPEGHQTEELRELEEFEQDLWREEPAEGRLTVRKTTSSATAFLSEHGYNEQGEPKKQPGRPKGAGKVASGHVVKRTRFYRSNRPTVRGVETVRRVPTTGFGLCWACGREHGVGLHATAKPSRRIRKHDARYAIFLHDDDYQRAIWEGNGLPSEPSLLPEGGQDG